MAVIFEGSDSAGKGGTSNIKRITRWTSPRVVQVVALPAPTEKEKTQWYFSELSPMDLEARSRWVDYSRSRDAMLTRTSTDHAPWYIVDANIKRHARLNVIAHLLSVIPYRDLTPDPLKLPPRQKAGGYKHPDFAELNFVPAVYP